MIVVALHDMARLAETNALLREVMIQRHGAEDFWLTDAAGAFRQTEAERAAQHLLLAPSRRSRSSSAASGAMNIMFIAVRVRTCEIGIRAATGASMREIRPSS